MLSFVIQSRQTILTPAAFCMLFNCCIDNVCLPINSPICDALFAISSYQPYLLYKRCLFSRQLRSTVQRNRRISLDESRRYNRYAPLKILRVDRAYITFPAKTFAQVLPLKGLTVANRVSQKHVPRSNGNENSNGRLMLFELVGSDWCCAVRISFAESFSR